MLKCDAEQAFSGINVLSMPFDEGVRKLLNALYSKGYIKNSSVQIVWAMKEAENANFDPAMIVNGFEKAIAEFGDENGIGVSVRMVDPNDAALQMGQQLDINSGAPGDDWESLDNITVERDSNGDVISYVETDSNGSKITYNAKKQKIHALIYHDTGYSEICYDESGKITKHTISENDGSEMELFYYASGSKSRVYTVYANDEFRDEYYSENGSRIKFIERRNISNGSYLIDYDTDGNGNADYQYVYKSDGSVWYNEFDMNGNQIPGTQKKIQ